MKKLALAFLAALLCAQPAAAQWQTPNHSVPIGTGAGTGFRYVTPGASGTVLQSAGAAADPVYAAVANSVSNSDGTLTISPTTGSVVASLNLAHVNTWTAIQTFTGGYNGYGVAAAPATPAAGFVRVFADSTTKTLRAINDAGTLSTSVIADTGAAHNFLTAISTGGVISKAQPACADLSDAGTGCSSSGAALTKTNDTNVTLTLGGSPTTALVNAASLTLGWTGTLDYTRGGCNASSQTACRNNIFPTPTRAGDIAYWNGSAWTSFAGNNSGTKVLQEDNTGTPSWVTGGAGTVTSITQGGIATLSTNPCVATCTIGTNATFEPQGRITLTTGTPYMSATVSAATHVYYTPAVGNLVAIWDGTNNVVSTFTEFDVTLGANWATNSNYDWFLAYDSSTLRFCTGPAWTSDTARGTGAGTTELTRVNGQLYNNVSITCRYANASTFTASASRALYVGSMRTGAAGQTNFVYAVSGTAGIIGIWNNYLRVPTPMWAWVSAGSYTYSTATIRQMGGNANTQVQFISGFATDSWDASLNVVTTLSAAVGAYKEYYVGYDSTSSASTGCSTSSQNGVAVAAQFSSSCRAGFTPVLGWHTVSGNELGDGVNNNTVIGGRYSNLLVNTRY